MSPQRNTVTDRESVKAVGRPRASRAAMLEAAHAVFAAAESPQAVTMDAVAAAAGVGKGTIFRAFGDRDGLLDALVEDRFAPFRAVVSGGEDPFADDGEPARRVRAFLDRVLDFKLDNHNLMRAREHEPRPASRHYRWMHDVLASWLAQADLAVPMSPSYAAHALLLPLQVDVLDQLLAGGTSAAELKRQQAHHVVAILGSES